MTPEQLEESERLHKELWNWLSENPMKEEVNQHVDTCYHAKSACSFTDGHCTSCPINWGENCTCMYDAEKQEMGLIYKWGQSENPEQRAELARKIRDLPWKFREEGNNVIKIKGDYHEQMD